MKLKVQYLDSLLESAQNVTGLFGVAEEIPENLIEHLVADSRDYHYPMAFYASCGIIDANGDLTSCFLYAQKEEHGVYYWVMDEEWKLLKADFLKDIGLSANLELEIIKELELYEFGSLYKLDPAFVRDMILENCDPERFAGETGYELLRASAGKNGETTKTKEETASGKTGESENKKTVDLQKEEMQEKTVVEALETVEPKEDEKAGKKKEPGKVH